MSTQSTRRTFLALLAAIPGLGFLARQPVTLAPPTENPVIKPYVNGLRDPWHTLTINEMPVHTQDVAVDSVRYLRADL